jgi:uncharacterized membrane protein YphA (DoxX/SURF4 family)
MKSGMPDLSEDPDEEMGHARGPGLMVFVWILQILLVVALVAAGGSKLAGSVPMVAMFDQIGAGQWLRYLTGSLEFLGAALVLIPGYAFYGAFLLALVMSGATLTHIFIIGGNPIAPIALFASAVCVSWIRRPAWLSA